MTGQPSKTRPAPTIIEDEETKRRLGWLYPVVYHPGLSPGLHCGDTRGGFTCTRGFHLTDPHMAHDHRGRVVALWMDNE